MNGTRGKQSRGVATRVRAVLAGGVVLGLGTTMTLAAWTDSDFANGLFAAGAFDLEGSVDGTTFESHPSSAPAALAFAVTPDNLAPGDVVYAPFAVQLAAGTTDPADVTITSTAAGTNAANLTYSLVTTATFGCSASTVAVSVLVPAGTGIATPVAPGTQVALDVGSPTTTAGDAVFLCFRVQAGAGLVGSATATATWRFTAQST